MVNFNKTPSHKDQMRVYTILMQLYFICDLNIHLHHLLKNNYSDKKYMYILYSIILYIMITIIIGSPFSCYKFMCRL